ncbi:MAG: hypothetical protein FWE49_00360 [Synergistaceae bacterium]|nr:hypothetical protein [Synergistaceae bacterium]
MLKNLLQKVFNFGQHEKEGKKESVIIAGRSDKTHDNKHEALSECFLLLRAARSQKRDKLSAESLTTLEKIIEIMEREGI